MIVVKFFILLAIAGVSHTLPVSSPKPPIWAPQFQVTVWQTITEVDWQFSFQFKIDVWRNTFQYYYDAGTPL